MDALHTSISLNSRRVKSWFSTVAHLLKLGDSDFSNLTMSRDLRKNSWIKLYTRKLENLFVQSGMRKEIKYLEIENRN